MASVNVKGGENVHADILIPRFLSIVLSVPMKKASNKLQKNKTIMEQRVEN